MEAALTPPGTLEWDTLDERWMYGIYRPPPLLPIDEWAEETIVLPRAASSEPGPLDLGRTPYLREVLRSATDPEVEELTLCWSTQLGKTMAIVIVVLHSLDQDPFPCLHVAPKEDDAVSINVDRYRPIVLESPRLRRHLTGRAHDMTRDALRMNGGSCHFVSSRTPSGLATRAVAKLVLDETDKYEDSTGREADPISLAIERTRTFPLSRKILTTSTPTTPQGYIWIRFQESDRRRYHVPCPYCERHQLLVFGGLKDEGSPGIKWPHGADAEVIRRDRLAWYECSHCHGEIRDHHKPAMLKAGVWVPEGVELTDAGKLQGELPPRRHSGYHLHCLYSPWLTFSEIAWKWLKSYRNLEALKNFRNSWMAEVWHERVDEVKTGLLRERRGGYKIGTVPPGAHYLAGGVDIQKDHCWYVIRAWGAHGESWLVREGRAETLQDVAHLMWRVPYYVSGTEHTTREQIPMRGVYVDTGHRPDEAYRWVRDGNANAVRGAAHPLRVITWTKRTNPDGTTTALILLDTAEIKRKIHRLIRTRDEDPGAWHLPEDVSEDYLSQLTAEQQVRETNRRTGRTTITWKLTSVGAANHLLDCEVYATAAAIVAGAFDLQRPKTPAAPAEVGGTAAVPPPKPPKKRKRFTRPQPKFFGRETNRCRNRQSVHQTAWNPPERSPTGSKHRRIERTRRSLKSRERAA